MGLLDYADAAREGLLGYLKDRKQYAKGLLGAAYDLATDPQKRAATVASMPAPFQPAGEQDMEAASAFWNPAGMLGKIVWHGSPHKFDKFDASKIGTGEGAQAYGHGVYLADSQDVAGQYRRVLSSALDTHIAANQLGIKRAQEYAAKWQAMLDDSTIQRPLRAADKKPVSDEWLKAQIKDEADEAERLSKWVNTKERGGVLYKADLPDEWIPKMLDWDSPISEAQRGPLSKAMMEKFGSGASQSNGEQILKNLAWEFKNAGSKNPQADAAAFMREAGIPGIRYLDGGSRSAGQGSYNYVVFPGLEDQIKILERNGVPLSGLLGGK